MLLAGAGVAYYYYASVDAERLLQKAIAKADRLDPGWTFAEIEARREVIPDSQNAILRVMSARQLQPGPNTVISVRDELEQLPPQEQLGNQLLKSIRTELQRATKVVEGARAIGPLLVDRLASSSAQEAVVPLKGLEDVVAAQTSISDIDGRLGKLWYVGYSIDDLAEHSTFEEVTYLLHHRRLPTRDELDELTEQMVNDRQAVHKDA